MLEQHMKQGWLSALQWYARGDHTFPQELMTAETSLVRPFEYGGRSSVGPTVHRTWLSLGNEVPYIRLDKTGLLNRRLLVSKAKTKNLGDLISLWKKTVLELKDSRTFYDADDIPKWLNRLHPLEDYRNFPWEDTTIVQSI